MPNPDLVSPPPDKLPSCTTPEIVPAPLSTIVNTSPSRSIAPRLIPVPVSVRPEFGVRANVVKPLYVCVPAVVISPPRDVAADTFKLFNGTVAPTCPTKIASPVTLKASWPVAVPSMVK